MCVVTQTNPGQTDHQMSTYINININTSTTKTSNISTPWKGCSCQPPVCESCVVRSPFHRIVTDERDQRDQSSRPEAITASWHDKDGGVQQCSGLSSARTPRTKSAMRRSQRHFCFNHAAAASGPNPRHNITSEHNELLPPRPACFLVMIWIAAHQGWQTSPRGAVLCGAHFILHLSYFTSPAALRP